MQKYKKIHVSMDFAKAKKMSLWMIAFMSCLVKVKYWC